MWDFDLFALRRITEGVSPRGRFVWGGGREMCLGEEGNVFGRKEEDAFGEGRRCVVGRERCV